MNPRAEKKTPAPRNKTDYKVKTSSLNSWVSWAYINRINIAFITRKTHDQQSAYRYKHYSYNLEPCDPLPQDLPGQQGVEDQRHGAEGRQGRLIGKPESYNVEGREDLEADDTQPPSEDFVALGT